MSRRSSSLVTVSLDNESANGEIEQPYSSTTVLEIPDYDEINVVHQESSSTERIFQVVLDLTPQDLSKEQATGYQLGACRKVQNWLQNCKQSFSCNKNFFPRYWNQVSEYFKRKYERLNGILEKGCDKSYLETYFLYANVCGVSPFHIGKDKQQVVWLKKVPYYIVNALAVCDTVGMTKVFILSMIGAHEERSASIRLYLSNSIIGASILLRAGYFVSLQIQSEKYLKAIRTISVSSYSRNLHKIKVFLSSLLVCGSSFSIVMIKTCVGFSGGIQEYIVENANEILFVFCFGSSCELTNLDTITPTTATLGLLGCATKLAGDLFMQTARDGIFFSALTLGKSANAFTFRRRLKDASLANSQRVGTDINDDYKWIKKISKHLNSAFNIIFRFYLLSNIFMFAVFIDEWFNPSLGKIAKGLKLANIVFVCITFYYANQTAKTGDRFREWMKKEKNRDMLGMTELNVLTENSSSSIGFGRGALFIYDSTLIGFASVVAAYFFGIVETRPQYDLHSGMENDCTCTNSSGLI